MRDIFGRYSDTSLFRSGLGRLGRCIVHAIAVLAATTGLTGAAEPSTIRFAIAADPGSLNPLLAHADANSVEAQLARLSFLPFLDLDSAGRLVPVLLARVPTVENGDLSRDGRTIVYRLRADRRWWDGQPVTSADVVFTLDAIRDARNPVASRAGYDRITEARALDAHTVRLRLREAWAPAVTAFFGPGAAPQFVLPAHVLARERNLAQSPFNEHPMGNGPFRPVQWLRGDRLRYERTGNAGVQRLDIRVVPDAGANYTALLSGALDWNLVSPAQWRGIANRPELRFTRVPQALAVGLALNTAHPPLDDVRVRRALAMAIDRRSISEKLTFGRYPVLDTAQPLGSWARDASVHLPAFSPTDADRTLDAAGWHRGADGIRVRDGKRLALTYVQFPESQTGVRTAAFIERGLRDRGFDVTIKSVPNATLFLPRTGTLATGAYDLAYVPWPMGADPDDAFLLSCNGAGNVMKWCDSKVDALERAAVREPRRDARRALYARIERRVAESVPIVFLFGPAYTYAQRAALAGFAPSAFTPTANAERWMLR